MAVVPTELIAQVQGQWSKFVVLSVLCLLLAASTIVGWYCYIQGTREARDKSDALARAQNQITDLGRQLQDSKEALLKAEARRAGTDGATDSQIAAAERARKDAEEKREAGEKARAELEVKLKAAEQGRSDVETRLKATEQARSDAESKLTASNEAKSQADNRAADAQRSVATLQEEVKRLQASVEMYRGDAQTAIENERKTAQRLQDALVAKAINERMNSSAVAPAPGSAQSPVSTRPAASDVASLTEKRLELPTRPKPATQPAVREVAAAGNGRDGVAAVPESQPGDIDPEVEAAKPEELLPWGEVMIVAQQPERAITLIRKAIEKGGRGADYNKSLGWALLRAGRKAEAKAALEAALAGFEDWQATSAKADPDQWTAAFLLGRVGGDEYAKRWAQDPKFGSRLACLPWFYAGQLREMEGQRDDAVVAYRLSVELGQNVGAHPIWHWAKQRLEELEKKESPASQPAK